MIFMLLRVETFRFARPAPLFRNRAMDVIRLRTAANSVVQQSEEVVNVGCGNARDRYRWRSLQEGHDHNSKRSCMRGPDASLRLCL